MPESIRVDTKVWYLELEELRPSQATATVVHAEVPYGPLNQLFYRRIGGDFHWTLHRDASDAWWQEHAERVETWLVLDRGTPGGYCEILDRPREVEILTFGLLAPFRGRGLGGALLTRGIERCLELAGGRPVTVNTCDLDGPHALDNYRARGFRVAREVVERRERLV